MRRILVFLAGSMVFALLARTAFLDTEATLVAWLGLPDEAQLRLVLAHPLARVERREDGSLGAWCACPVPVTAEDIPAHLRDALVAVEDHRFRTHGGIDWIAVARAVSAADGQGGSTLTQQLAKTIVGSERSYARKLREALLAQRIERLFAKEEIVVLYLNRVHFGRGLWGVEQAARHYFGKRTRDLNLYEGALLAGMLKGPATYDPIARPDAARDRATIVLARMVDRGFVDDVTARRAAADGFRRGTLTAVDFAAGHYLEWVVRQVRARTAAAPKDGERWHVVLTLDPSLQRLAADSVSGSVAEAADEREVALVAMNGSGEVLALIGGRDYAASQIPRATRVPRQPASTFKPFVYLAALEAGRDPESEINDEPVEIEGWRPRNHDGAFLGRMTLTEALAQSRNAAAVRLAQEIGIDRVRATARRFGLPVSAGPAFLLGAAAVTPLDLTAAYGGIANGGYRVAPEGIHLVLDHAGRVVPHAARPSPRRVAAAADTARLEDMLTSAARHRLGPDSAAAGKSGTSNAARDAWFVGFADGIVAGVWTGHDDRRSLGTTAGGTSPTAIWRAFMAGARGGGDR